MENKIKIGQYDITYVKVGNGAHSVLCMPGVMGDIWANFKPQIEGFDLEKFTLIVWDPPDQGESRPPKKEFPNHYLEKNADFAFKLMKNYKIHGNTDVRKFVGKVQLVSTTSTESVRGETRRRAFRTHPDEDHRMWSKLIGPFQQTYGLNIPKFSLMGWCNGGISSIMLATDHPEAVQKLVVWGVRSFILHHELEFYNEIKSVSKWSESWRKPMIELYGEEKMQKLWTEFVDSLDIMYNAHGGNICSELIKNVSCPTFILNGEKDPVTDKIHAWYLYNKIQGSRLYRYPAGKHNIHLRFAKDFNQRVQEFLNQG